MEDALSLMDEYTAGSNPVLTTKINKMFDANEKSKEQKELDSYLEYLNSAMAPFEMKKLKELIDRAIKAKVIS